MKLRTDCDSLMATGVGGGGGIVGLSVFLGELLDPAAADFELLGNQRGIHVVINNSLTDSGDIRLVKLHLARSIVGDIMPTKSLADTTLLGTDQTLLDLVNYSAM